MSAPRYTVIKYDFSQLKLTAKDYDREFFKARFYTNYEIDSKKLKPATMAWIKKNTEYDFKILNSLPDYEFDAIGKYGYMLQNGGELTPEIMASFHKHLQAMQENAGKRAKSSVKVEVVTAEAKPAAPKKANIQDHLREKAAEACSNVDHWIDSFCTDPKTFNIHLFDIKKHFLHSNLKVGHYRHISKFYEPDLAEIAEAIGGQDEQLNEGYSYLTKPQLKKLHGMFQDVLNAVEHLKASSTPAKKPRQKKAIDVAKVVSKLKFKEVDTDLGITSIRPVNLVASKEIWVYNTKTKKLGVYIAADAAGLTVKGTAIKGFSEKSVEKSIRKNTTLSLKSFMKANKTNKKKEFTAVTGIETKLNGRLNEHVLILSVEK
jgi:hypothetical protein